MKRRKFLSIASYSPSLLLLCSCKEKFSETPTTVTGMVVDKNGSPAKGVNFRYYGAIPKGFSYTETFSVEVTADDQGVYRASYIVPVDTLVVELIHFSNEQ